MLMLMFVWWYRRKDERKKKTYQSLPVEAILTSCKQALDQTKRIAVQPHVTVDAQARCVLQPKAAVDNVAQVWVCAAVLVKVGKGQVEHVAGAHEVGAVALDKGMEALGGQGQDVEGVAQALEVEDVGGPAVRVGQGGQVFAVLDLELGRAREVVGALGFCEPRQARAGVDEVGEDLVDNLGGERLEGALGGERRCGGCAWCAWCGGCGRGGGCGWCGGGVAAGRLHRR